MISKIGDDAAEFREVEEQGRIVREPVMAEAHKAGMVRDLYRAGWSTRLIAQLCQDDHAVTVALLTRPAPE